MASAQWQNYQARQGFCVGDRVVLPPSSLKTTFEMALLEEKKESVTDKVN